MPRVQWYRDGVELNDPRFVAHCDGSQRCQLTIQELRDADSGRYMCEATNRVGRVSTFARLFVVNDPKILEADHKLKRWVNIMMSACLRFFFFFMSDARNVIFENKECESRFPSKTSPLSEREMVGFKVNIPSHPLYLPVTAVLTGSY